MYYPSKQLFVSTFMLIAALICMSFMNVVMADRFPKPTGVNATDGAFLDHVRVTWNGVAGATVYRVFRCIDFGLTCGLPIGFPRSTGFNDYDGSYGIEYWYAVKACSPGEPCSHFSDFDTGYRGEEREPEPMDIEERVAELEALTAELQTAMERVSPIADLTDTTYCIFGQGTWLATTNSPGKYAEVGANPFSARLDFTSDTELTITTLYDAYSGIVLPPYIMNDEALFMGIDQGTYAVEGNRLTIVTDEDEEAFYMTADARVLVGGFFERSVDSGIDIWESGMITGVRAASCD